jgi:hypothetical protein
MFVINEIVDFNSFSLAQSYFEYFQSCSTEQVSFSGENNIINR